MHIEADTHEQLPEWFVAEAYRVHTASSWHFRCGVRCRDGDLKILDIPVNQLVSLGRRARIALTKRQVLEELQSRVAVELARLSLEE